MNRATQLRALWAMVLLAALAVCLSACGGSSSGSGALSITTSTLPEGWSHEPYSATLQATGGRPPYTWSVGPPRPNLFSTLHRGLTLSSSGTISGIPTESGTAGPTFVVTDSDGRTTSKVITLTIHLSVMLDPAPLQDGILGRPYFGEVRIWGGQGPYTLSLTPNSDPLPPGLILTSVGSGGFPGFHINGTPLSTGTARLEFQVRDDSRSRTVTGTYPLRIVDRLRISPASLPAAGVGFPYSVTFSVSGGVPPYTWSLVGGSQPLPPGLSFDPAGTISGTPTSPGTFATFVKVTDSGSPPQTGFPGSLWIVDQFTMTKTWLVFGVVQKSYRDRLEAAGGEPPFTWSVLPPQFGFDNLPPGTSLNSNGEISGIPTSTGSFRPNIEVRDSASPQRVARGTVSIEIGPRVSFRTTTLADAAEQRFYDDRVFLSGGLVPFTFRITSGILPPGLALNPSILVDTNSTDIMGTPTTVGQFPFTLELTDSTSPPDVISQALVIRVNPQLVFNPPSSLPDGLEGSPYTFSFTASGGLPPYLWEAFSHPSGLTMGPTTGTLSGVPGQPWVLNLGVRVSDSSSPPQQITRYLPFRVIERLRTTTNLPPLRVGVAAHIRLGTSGGVPPFRWTFVSGNLPAGLTFNTPTGEITGTPTSVESQTFTFRLEDSGTSFPQSIQQTLTLTTVATLPRNDSVATATPLSNGSYRATISPMEEVSGALYSDNDYYAITANPGAVVGVEITAELLSPPSPMDSVIEFVDANGQRLFGCDFSRNAFGFNWNCMNDDDFGRGTRDSALYFKVPGIPGSSGPPFTFYVRVLEWRGDARPDFFYFITISGAN